MDGINKLDVFRKDWEQELSSSKDNNKCIQNEGKLKLHESQKSTQLAKESYTSHSSSIDTTNSSYTSKHGKEKLEHDDHNMSGSEIIYACSVAPFKIAKAILDPECSTSSDRNINKSISYCQNVAKRKMDKSERSKVKKKSKISLDDIFSDRQEGEMPKERLLDKLIADIDEITEIPFFDISIPREVAINIFQCLNLQDLCHCAQVSKSWKSLAEDELLWCRICHGLGQETIYSTREKTNWKQVVQHNIERQRLLKSNWKGRIGKLTQLEHAKGKLLCSVDSCNDHIAAGYTNGDVKVWDLASGDSCVFQPSSTALVVGGDDEDLRQNIVTSLVTSSTVTAAAYTHGNIDIWSLDSGTHPLHTYKPYTPNNERYSAPVLCLSKDGSTIVLNYGPYIEFLHRQRTRNDFYLADKVDNVSNVTKVKIYDNSHTIPSVIFSKCFSVNLVLPAQPDLIGAEYHMTAIHDVIGDKVEAFDFKTDQSVLGVYLGSYDGYGTGYRIQIYDIPSGRLSSTIHGQTSFTTYITCMNMYDSPANEFVTAMVDNKILVFDIRTDSPIQKLVGHKREIRCLQMDDWKVVSGSADGYLYVWDRRMGNKLWELHNMNPVQYCRFNDKSLIVANICDDKFPKTDEFDSVNHKRYRGSLNTFNFLEDLTTQDVPEICLSTYDQPEASRYNIGLAMPYDTLSY